MLARNSSTAERLVGRLVPAVGAIAVCAAALAAVPGDTPGITPDSVELPDLDQELPWDLQAFERYELRRGFRTSRADVTD